MYAGVFVSLCLGRQTALDGWLAALEHQSIGSRASVPVLPWILPCRSTLGDGLMLSDAVCAVCLSIIPSRDGDCALTPVPPEACTRFLYLAFCHTAVKERRETSQLLSVGTMDPEKKEEGDGPPARNMAAPDAPNPSGTSPCWPPKAEEVRDETGGQNRPDRSRLHSDSAVSVGQAQDEFAELEKRLSGLARRANDNSSSQTGTAADIETGADPCSSAFDLEAAIRGGFEAEAGTGMRPKHLGVYWDGLTVEAPPVGNDFAETFWDYFFRDLNVVGRVRTLLGWDKKRPQARLLSNLKGVCRPGEMVLVLGKPGSGCSTFLKAITNRRWDYTRVSGEVRYGPFTAGEMRRFRGEILYNDEEDLHHVRDSTLR